MINTAPPSSNSVYGRENFFPVTLFLFLCTVFFFFFLTLFFLLAFFLPLTLLVMHLDQYINIYLELESGVSFCKRDFKSSWSAYWPCIRPEKKHKLSRPVPPLKQLIFFFFSVLVDIMTNNIQYTTDCANLHPTPTIDPLKVKLAFCTSS